LILGWVRKKANRVMVADAVKAGDGEAKVRELNDALERLVKG
jgi:hypothetical protein